MEGAVVKQKEKTVAATAGSSRHGRAIVFYNLNLIDGNGKQLNKSE